MLLRDFLQIPFSTVSFKVEPHRQPIALCGCIPEFIAYEKANLGKLNMASAGNGTPQYVYIELFKLQTGST